MDWLGPVEVYRFLPSTQRLSLETLVTNDFVRNGFSFTR